ncbi:MAG: metallophosphatase family protein [Deltaproteobacteria bacterium]|nr:metallophosphatase family protein [Deltaproteobacteria bacterium]
MASERIDLPEGPARIAVVADSHSKPHSRALELVSLVAPPAILHAGDIGNLRVLDDLEAIAPLFAVRGNIDGHDPRTPDYRIIDLERDGRRILRILLTHIAVYGPKLRKDVRERARAEGAQLVVCGHSHVPLVAADHGITVFNPGSLGPRRFQLPIVFGVLEIGDKLGFSHIDCETGEAWSPPG